MLLLIFNFHQLKAQGIQFASTDFPTALEIAKQQNKLVFINVYTDWCGPCKAMEKNIFPQEKVSQLYNGNFICCRINAEKDGGPDVVKRYEVNAYPTFLFITPKGELIAKGVGYKESADPFIELGRSALHKKATNYSLSQLANNYEQNKNDKQFLTAYIARLDSLDLKKDLVPVLDQYCQLTKTPSDDDYNLLIKHLYTASSTSFDILVDHQAPKFPLSIFAFRAQFYQIMKDTGALFQALQQFSDTLLPSIFPIAASIDSMYAINAQNPKLKGSYTRYLAYTINNAADKYLRNSTNNNDYKKALTLSQQSLTLSIITLNF